MMEREGNGTYVRTSIMDELIDSKRTAVRYGRSDSMAHRSLDRDVATAICNRHISNYFDM